MEYYFNEIEERWQKYWNDKKVFKADEKSNKKPYYALEMFPYPSGKIHMGHVSNYTIVDAIARYHSLKGYEVLHPIGWDAFGMPAENAAIENNIPPAKWTYANIEYMKKQLKRLGFSYDWDREVTTCKKDYYKWGQWFLLKMYEKGLLYRKKGEVNWCDSCNTVLANEQVTVEGNCWRCDSEVQKKSLEQWYIRITDYAEELLSGHDEIKDGWPEHVLSMQKHWVGKSYGATIEFKLDDDSPFPIFTTRPDTIYGVKFMAIAWNHTSLLSIVTDEQKDEVNEFIKRAQKINQREEYEKEGVFTGRSVINPFTGEKVPLYAANFVLAEYGHGQIMAVPAHDQRDFEFAKKYGIGIKVVIQNENKSLVADEMEEAYTEEGILVNSSNFDGMKNTDAKLSIISFAEKKGFGKKEVQYKLRDWLISRQRYWGNPIPFVYCEKCGVVPVSEKDLPVELPENIEIAVGENALAKDETFVNTKCPQCGADAKRETDTMDTFTCSSWYYARYIDANNTEAPFSKEAANKWLPVNQYVGGIEHACMHLLYSRFWHKFMRDIGLTKENEPFKRLLTQGMVVCESYFSPKLKKYYTRDEYESGLPQKEDAGEIKITVDKMSKSKKNGVDPDEMIKHFGADAVRLFVMFASPPEMDVEWSDEGLKGASRFLARLWRYFVSNASVAKSAEIKNEFNGSNLGEKAKECLKATHKSIKKVTHDISERFHFNTAIASLMELLNTVNSFTPQNEEEKSLVGFILRVFAVLLNPITPHITEEFWMLLGMNEALAENGEWPSYEESLTNDENFELVLQVNGKIRDRLEVSAGITKEEAEKIALENEKVKEHCEGKNIVKIIYVAKKLVNIVVK